MTEEEEEEEERNIQLTTRVNDIIYLSEMWDPPHAPSESDGLIREKPYGECLQLTRPFLCPYLL